MKTVINMCKLKATCSIWPSILIAFQCLIQQPAHAQTIGQAVEQPTWLWNSYGPSGPWFSYFDNNAVGGVCAMAAGVSGYSSYLQTTVTGPGTLTFYYMGTGSTGPFSYYFQVDSQPPTYLPTFYPFYSSSSVVLSAGTHTLTWYGAGDSSSSVRLDNVSFTGAVSPTIITMSPLPSGTVASSYSLTFVAGGGRSPYSWSVTSNGLPAGLSLSTGGVLSGTPSMVTNCSFMVQVMGTDGGAASRLYSLTIMPGEPTITTASPLSTGMAGTPYSKSMSVNGSTAPYAWSIISGGLPAGLNLSTNGVLGGTPLAATNNNFTIQVIGNDGRSTNKAFSLTILPADAAYVFTTFVGLPGTSGYVNATGSVARLNGPYSIAIEDSGNFYVADSYNCTIRKVRSDGAVTTLAGTGSYGSADGTGSEAQFWQPSGVAVDGLGNVFVADSLNATIRKITAAGVVTTLAGSAGLTGSTDGTNSAARFRWPNSVAVDAMGNLYVADEGNHTIRRLAPAGTNWVVTTVAGAAGVVGSADGTGSAARFNYPTGVALDSAGNLYVSDYSNHTIRKMTPVGTNWVVTTLAGIAGSSGSVNTTSGGVAQFSGPTGLVVDTAGNIYVADDGNHELRKVTPAGVVTTVASLWCSGVAVDNSGSLYATSLEMHDIVQGVTTNRPTITTTSPLPSGIAGVVYNQALVATGGTTPYTWSIVTGGLPAGLSLSSDGVIGGTPEGATNASLTVQVRGTNGLSSSKAFSLTIVAPPVGDDFAGAVADTNKWGSYIHAGPGGQLDIANGQLQFLGSNTVVRPWIGSVGSYTQDWELTLDVNLGNVALSQDNSQVRIGLSVADLGGWFTPYGTPLNSLEVGLGLRRLSGQTYRAFGAQIRTNNAMAVESLAMTTNQHASVRVTFAAATKTLSTWYDASGNTNAHTWIALSAQQINTPPIDWGMTNCSGFGFALVAEGDGYMVNAGDQVYADNFVLTGSVPAPPTPASLGDAFNFAAPDPDKWGPDLHMGPGGKLVLTNGQLQFLGTDAAIRPWIGSYGSYTQDWQVTLDVNLGSVVLTQNASHAQVVLVVVNQNDPVTQYGLPGDNFSIALDLYSDSGGQTERSFEVYLRTNWTEIYPRASVPTTAQHASLRISFSAASKTLTAWYNSVGSGNACSWTPLQSARIDAAGSNWEMGNGSSFGFAAGVGCGGYTVSASDQVYADNFVLTGSVPSAPTPASLGDAFVSAVADPNKWGPDMIADQGAQFVRTNGQLQFLGSNAVVKSWIGSYGSYTQNWELIVDVNLGHMALTQDSPEPRNWVGFGLASLDCPWQAEGTPTTSLDFGLGLTRLSGQTYRTFGARMYTNATLAVETDAPTTNEHASLRVTFDAAAKTLACWYDASGDTNAHHWTILSVYQMNVPPIDWGMTDSSLFRFALVGVCEDYTVTVGDQVYLDNFGLIGTVPAPPPMVNIPAGPFQMGNNNTNELWYQFVEYPEHTVYVNAFQADRYEVSNEQMRRVIQWAYDSGKVYADSGSVTNLEGDRQQLLVLDDKDSRLKFSGGHFYVTNNMGNFPCAEVTWYGAQAYCNYKSDMEGLPRCINFTNWSCDFSKNGYRLPTEAEWEKAARGGLTGQYFPWPSYAGSYSNHINGTQANYLFSGDPYGSGDASNNLAVTPVGYYNGHQVITNQAGQLLAGQDMTNGYGLYDMAGNLYEWCYDWADALWYRQAGATNNDTTGPAVASTNYIGAVTRIMRGGSWEETPEELRCAARAANEPGDKGNGIGFRAVRTVLTGTPTNSTLPVPIISEAKALGGGLFGFTVSGPAGLVAIIEASTNLVNWVPIQTNALVNGEVRFSDPQAAAFPKRFYRAR